MSKLVWDAVGEHYFENGTKMGVLFPMASDGTYERGVAWNGLTAVSESPDGGDATALYADDIKYLTLRAAENAKGTIEAYTYPDEFAACDGSATIGAGVYVKQQPRKKFGFCYRTNIGNDVNDQLGYKLHIIYNASVSPSSKDYETINDSPDAITMSWEYEADPVDFGTGFRPSATIEIDSTKVDAAKLTALEAKLYGTDATVDPVASATDPELPTPAWIIENFGPSGASGVSGASGESGGGAAG